MSSAYCLVKANATNTSAIGGHGLSGCGSGLALNFGYKLTLPGTMKRYTSMGGWERINAVSMAFVAAEENLAVNRDESRLRESIVREKASGRW